MARSKVTTQSSTNTRSVSQTSNGKRGADAAAASSETGSSDKRRGTKREPRWYDILAPPKTRGRKREARRWLDVLNARRTNGLPRERRPGQRHIMPSEASKMFEAALAELSPRDPALFKAVQEVMWDNNIADLGITMEEWRKRALRRAERLAKVRASLPLSELQRR